MVYRLKKQTLIIIILVLSIWEKIKTVIFVSQEDFVRTYLIHVKKRALNMRLLTIGKREDQSEFLFRVI